MMKFVTSFVKDETGATAIEYALLIGLVSLAIIGSATALGGKVKGLFEKVGAKLDGVKIPG